MSGGQLGFYTSSVATPNPTAVWSCGDRYYRNVALKPELQVVSKLGKSGYLPTLDGWRALAILAVILHHDALHSVHGVSTQWFYRHGNTGVDVFFAISGVLICSRLLDEERKYGRIDLRKFYVRRALRILPPSLLFLIVLALLSSVSVVHVSVREWLESLLFCRNYPTLLGVSSGEHNGWYTSHFWSLSLEEQFYLLLPMLLVVTARRFRLSLLLVVSALIAIYRFFELRHLPWQHIQFHAGVRLDALFVPASLAVLISTDHLRDIFQRWLRIWPLLLLVATVIISRTDQNGWSILGLVILMPAIILGSTLNPGDPLSRVLEWRWLRFVGRISYSLYLWQQLFFSEHFLGPSHAVWQSWPSRVLLLLTCALGSYYLLERPFIRLGQRYAPSATTGRPAIVGTA